MIASPEFSSARDVLRDGWVCEAGFLSVDWDAVQAGCVLWLLTTRGAGEGVGSVPRAVSA